MDTRPTSGHEKTMERIREARSRLPELGACVRCSGTGMQLVAERRQGINLPCRRCGGGGHEPFPKAV
jgi:hypothetical protein